MPVTGTSAWPEGTRYATIPATETSHLTHTPPTYRADLLHAVLGKLFRLIQILYSDGKAGEFLLGYLCEKMNT